MKSLFALFALVFAHTFFPAITQAQDVLTEGAVSFQVSDVKSDNPNVKQVLKGSINDVHFKGAVSRNDIQMMNGAIRIHRLRDQASQSFDVYMDMMGKQIKVSVPDSVQKSKRKQAEENTNITYDETTTKVIQGYTCYKATIEAMAANGTVQEMEVYITEAIKAPASTISGMPENLKGFPLEYKVKAGETEITYTLKSLNKTVATDAFTMANTYIVMPYKEFEASIGKQMGL